METWGATSQRRGKQDGAGAGKRRQKPDSEQQENTRTHNDLRNSETPSLAEQQYSSFMTPPRKQLKSIFVLFVIGRFYKKNTRMRMRMRMMQPRHSEFQQRAKNKTSSSISG